MNTNYRKPGHAALRKGRHSIARQIYFVTVCCEKRQRTLQSHDSARAAARTMHELHLKKHVNLIAWILMPDHMHLLIELDEFQTVPAIMARINSCVAKAINKALCRSGSVWQGAYHDHALRTDEDCNAAIRYLLNNPIRAGLVTTIDTYPYWNISNWQGPLLDID